MGSIVLKTFAWVVFALTLAYAGLSLLEGATNTGVGCAIVGIPFWLISLKFGTDLARRERIAEAQERKRARRAHADISK